MGLYDSIFLYIECPYCKHTNELKVQTKQLYNLLSILRVGDFATTELEYINGIVGCTTDKCVVNGSSHYFNINIHLKDGFITNKYDIISFDIDYSK